jgi:hypothetical protein
VDGKLSCQKRERVEEEGTSSKGDTKDSLEVSTSLEAGGRDIRCTAAGDRGIQYNKGDQRHAK